MIVYTTKNAKQHFGKYLTANQTKIQWKHFAMMISPLSSSTWICVKKITNIQDFVGIRIHTFFQQCQLPTTLFNIINESCKSIPPEVALMVYVRMVYVWLATEWSPPNELNITIKCKKKVNMSRVYLMSSALTFANNSTFRVWHMEYYDVTYYELRWYFFFQTKILTNFWFFLSSQELEYIVFQSRNH